MIAMSAAHVAVPAMLLSPQSYPLSQTAIPNDALDVSFNQFPDLTGNRALEIPSHHAQAQTSLVRARHSSYAH